MACRFGSLGGGQRLPSGGGKALYSEPTQPTGGFYIWEVKKNLWCLHHRTPKGHGIFIVFNGSCIFKRGKTLLRRSRALTGAPRGLRGRGTEAHFPGHFFSQAAVYRRPVALGGNQTRLISLNTEV